MDEIDLNTPVREQSAPEASEDSSPAEDQVFRDCGSYI